MKLQTFIDRTSYLAPEPIPVSLPGETGELPGPYAGPSEGGEAGAPDRAPRRARGFRGGPRRLLGPRRGPLALAEAPAGPPGLGPRPRARGRRPDALRRRQLPAPGPLALRSPGSPHWDGPANSLFSNLRGSPPSIPACYLKKHSKSKNARQVKQGQGLRCFIINLGLKTPSNFKLLFLVSFKKYLRLGITKPLAQSVMLRIFT